MEQPTGIIITAGFIKYHTCAVMGMVFVGMGTVWEIPTCAGIWQLSQYLWRRVIPYLWCYGLCNGPSYCYLIIIVLLLFSTYN